MATDRPTRALMQHIQDQGLMKEYGKKVTELTKQGHTPSAAHRYVRKEYMAVFGIDALESSELPAWVTLAKKIFKDKPKISHKEAVDWAIENVAFKDVKAKDAPSATSWLYLQRMRTDEGFLHDVLKKRVPNLSKVQQTQGMSDDGREHINLIEKLEAEASPGSTDTVLPSGTKAIAC